MSENSGGDVNYYRVEVTHPKRTEPYVAECEDIIAALGMDFFEGEAFKAAWRKAAQRTLGVGKEGNTALRDAQKMAHYGARCLAMEGYRITYPAVEVPEALPVHSWLAGDAVRFTGETRQNFEKGGLYRVVESTNLGSVSVKGLSGFIGSWPFGAAATEWTWAGRP